MTGKETTMNFGKGVTNFPQNVGGLGCTLPFEESTSIFLERHPP